MENKAGQPFCRRLPEPILISKSQTQEVIGIFIEYDARKGLNNQEITPDQIVLDFKPLQVKRYKELSTSVLAKSMLIWFRFKAVIQ